MAFGLLTGKYNGVPQGSRATLHGYEWLREESLTETQARAYTALAREAGLSPAQLAIAWCLRTPAVRASLPVLRASSRCSRNPRVDIVPQLTPELLGRLDGISVQENRIDPPGGGRWAMTHILVTNDDGITSPGLLALAHALIPLGTVSVLAPDHNWSASGHVKTLHKPLRVRTVHLEDGTRALSSTARPPIALHWRCLASSRKRSTCWSRASTRS